MLLLLPIHCAAVVRGYVLAICCSRVLLLWPLVRTFDTTGKPLAVAKRKLACQPTMLARATFNLLNAAKRECTIRAKLQIVRRHQAQQRADARKCESLELQAALESAGAALDRADRTWHFALQQAELSRQAAEAAYVDAKAQAAVRAANEWLESKDGQNYVKKHLPIATLELKLDVQSGKAAKRIKDAKEEATNRVCEAFCQEKEVEAKRLAIDAFRAKNPPYSRESWKLPTK